METMIYTPKNETVPYELCKQLAEIGFDTPCWWWWDEIGNFYDWDLWSGCVNLKMGKDCYAAPLYQQVFRWFREKHNILQDIDWMTRSGGNYPSGYIVHFRGINGNKLNDDNFIGYNKTEFPGYEVIPTYEEAQMACVKELINMVKNKQS
jgi:hypothetical protein